MPDVTQLHRAAMELADELPQIDGVDIMSKRWI